MTGGNSETQVTIRLKVHAYMDFFINKPKNWDSMSKDEKIDYFSNNMKEDQDSLECDDVECGDEEIAEYFENKEDE